MEEDSFLPGAVVKLKLKDFMQFREVEHIPGPTLNVILGPNGAGKSTIVNAIALGLGAKTAVLGRADHIVDFIRTGCDAARLDIEIKNDQVDQSNYIITRIINKIAKDGNEEREKSQLKHTEWFINGKKSKQADVDKLTKKFGIQCDNLCQFLPQDKVHDFSKMNPKELLVKTVDAVGDVELKKDHQELKELQCKLNDSGDKNQKKRELIEKHRAHKESLEEAVESFKKRNVITQKLKLVTQKKEWALVSETQALAEEAQTIRDQARKDYDEASARKPPIQKEIREIQNSKSKAEAEIRANTMKYKEMQNQALKKTLKIEGLEDECKNIDEEFRAIRDQEEQKKEQLKKYEEELEKITNEYENAVENSSDRNNSLEEKCKKLQEEMETINNEKCTLEQESKQLKYERNVIQNRLNELNREKDQLNNITKQKKDTLRNGLRNWNGEDAVIGMEWLEKNRDKFSGRVYEPMLMLIDVQDAEANAKFLEAVIHPRDLVAFAAENAEDTNALMKHLRALKGNSQNLRVNVIQVDSQIDLNQYQPRTVLSDEKKSKYGFKGYLKDMLTCPDAIKGYLCKTYGLHNVPVFSNKAEAYFDELTKDFRLLFIGDTRHSVIISTYSGNASTSSNGISKKNWLQTSLDKTRLNEISKETRKKELEFENLKNQMNEIIGRHTEKKSELEDKRKECKSHQEKMNEKKVLKGRMLAREGQLTAYKKNMKPLDLEKERSKFDAKKLKVGLDSMKLAKEVKNIVIEMSHIRIKLDVLKLSVGPSNRKEEILKNKLDDLVNEVNDLEAKLGDEDGNLYAAKDVYFRQLAKAQSEIEGPEPYKGSKPPKALVKQWRENDIDEISSNDAQVKIYNYENDLAGMNTNEDGQEKEKKYKDLKETIENLENELADSEQSEKDAQDKMEEIADRWVSKLEALIGRISEQFSKFFNHMGFAGELKLDKGDEDENGLNKDFKNFGINVMVKFRENGRLERLDPFKQSGGERSVSTALYMMALQALTKVPFRCVDEINQGMDERNERKVFDLLIETSVQKNSAQYFLLTPKLLPGLNYERGVKVHVVHNGAQMCENNKWNLERFKTIGRARNNA